MYLESVGLVAVRPLVPVQRRPAAVELMSEISGRMGQLIEQQMDLVTELAVVVQMYCCLPSLAVHRMDRTCPSLAVQLA